MQFGIETIPYIIRVGRLCAHCNFCKYTITGTITQEVTVVDATTDYATENWFGDVTMHKSSEKTWDLYANVVNVIDERQRDV